MNTPLVFTITKEDKGYSASCQAGEYYIFTDGDTFDGLKKKILDVTNFTFKEAGLKFTSSEIQYRFDLESFFEFYRVINAKALAERIGMNQSLLAQYIKGKKNPSEPQVKRILKGVRQIGKELSEASFLI